MPVSQAKRPARRLLAAASVAAALVLAACGGGGTGSTPTASGNTPQRGGTLTVLEGSGFAGAWPAGLDPATNTNGAADQSYMESIYGQLFELDEHGKIVPDLATGYELADGGKTVVIKLRHGVKFTDGTPFDAEAVAWNINRDLQSPCTCRPTWPVTSVTATDPYTVTIKLSRVFAPIISSFIDSNANWIASPTAVQKMGEKQFALTPVGAGPFKVVSDTLSSVLVLERNPDYWQKGHPYLDRLIFKSVGGDEAALEAMEAGEGQAYEGMSTLRLIEQAQSSGKFTVTKQLSTSPYDIQFNTAIPPFNDIRAREAIYYATNVAEINRAIFQGQFQPTQSFTGPGGLFYMPKVKGYPGYDLAKAKALVKQLGGLDVHLGTINVLVAQETIQALQTQWAKAGIKTTIDSYDLAALISQFQSGKWQAMLQTAGAFDPAVGVGVGFRFSSQSPFSGVHDPHLDDLLNQAASTLDMNVRAKYYREAAEYIAQKFYGPFFFAFSGANVALKGVHGPGLTTAMPAVVVNPDIPWEDVWTTIRSS